MALGDTKHIANRKMRRGVALGMVCLGATAFVAQMLTLQEFLDVFSGNELSIGVILGNWLLLTGTGSFLGRYAHRIRFPVRRLVCAQVAIALLPAAQITAIRMLKGAFPAGAMVGINEIFWGSFFLLLPFCLTSGFLLAFGAGLLSSRREPDQVGSVYVLDTVGGIAGGLLFSFLLVRFLAPFQSAALLAAANLVAALYLSHAAARRSMGLAVAAVLLLTLGIFGGVDLEGLTGRAMFPGLDVVSRQSTPYGHLAVVRQERQVTVFENGVPVGSTHDPAAAEEIVHYALSQHPDPRDVLLVSGGLAGAPHEIEKYSVKRIDYVELDPAVLALATRLGGGNPDSRLHAIRADARTFIRSRHNTYDAILMALPDPSSARINRYYTTEFFAEVRRALRPGGVFSFSLSGAENYANDATRTLASAVYKSLASVFPNTLLVPGARQYFVASNRSLGYDFAEKLKRRGIATRYVRAEYLRAKLTVDRIAAARGMVSARTPANRDFHPVTYHAYLRYWLSQFGSGMLLPALLTAALLILAAALIAASRKPEVPAAIAASGFSGMGMEVVLLIAFQICHGYVYQEVGLIVTGFMVGAAAGAAWSRRQSGNPAKLLLRLDTALAATAFLAALLPAAASASGHPFLQGIAAPAIFPLLNGAVGFAVGAQFPPAARLTFRGVEETAGDLFAFDLLGACAGALIVSTLCLPLLGISATCCLLGAVKLISAAALRLRRDATFPSASTRTAPALGASLAFGFTALSLTGIGAAIVAEQTSGSIYAVSFAPVYSWTMAALLALGIVGAMYPERLARSRGGRHTRLCAWADKLRAQSKVPFLRWVYFCAFSLPVFYPIFRCYFKVPYLFCHACPRKCIFGFMRPYLVPGALVMNLENRYWCHHACPIGTLSDCQARVCRKSRHAPKAFRHLATGVLVFTALAYFKIQSDLAGQPDVAWDWYTFFYKNTFDVSLAVIATTAALIAVAYLLRRPFCEALCPVGTLSALVRRQETSWAADRRVPTRRAGDAAVTEAARSPR